MAIIGYPSNSRTETAPGRHLIGQRRLLRGPGHIFTGCARFWLFNSRRVPDYHAPYPIMASNTRALRPTAHTRAIPGPCSQLSTTMAFFQIDSIQGSRLLVPLLLSLSHTQPTNRSHTQPRTRDHRSCDRPTMSDRTTKLTEKQCYPDTKALRTAVGEFFAHDSRSFTASKNSRGKQKTYFRSGKEGGCEALLDYLYY